MLKRPWQSWAWFCVAVTVVLLSMGWFTWTVVRLDRSEAIARRDQAEAARELERFSETENRVRLALWSMDTELSKLLTKEDRRSPFVFRPQIESISGKGKLDNVSVVSPLLIDPSPEALLYFQFDKTGKLTTLLAPEEAKKWIVGNTLNNSEQLIASVAQSEAFKQFTSYAKLRDQLSGDAADNATSWQIAARSDNQSGAHRTPDKDPALDPLSLSRQSRSYQDNNAPPDVQQDRQALANPQAKGNQQIARIQAQQRAQSNFEFVKRRNAVNQATAFNNGSDAYAMLADPAGKSVRKGDFKPVWLGENLVLIRKAFFSESEHIQGCWLDWPRIRKRLLGLIKTEFPNASLEPITEFQEHQQWRTFAAMPIQLNVGEVPLESLGELASISDVQSSRSVFGWPLWVTLIVAWGCVLLASGAVAFLLWGAISLSERRATFVSTITHELRTPLTTFRLYTELLEGDKIADGERRRGYLKTLKDEAQRLSHLVENVLGYARLERKNHTGPTERLTARALLEPMLGRLFDRCLQANMEFKPQLEDVGDMLVQVDPPAAEQILYNLVDNAAKYAAKSDDRRIHLRGTRQGKWLLLEIRDHGPGISSAESRNLFQPFAKVNDNPAIPGVGLGLALSRRLARDLGGDLTLATSDDGACFQLRLPLARKSGGQS